MNWGEEELCIFHLENINMGDKQKAERDTDEGR